MLRVRDELRMTLMAYQTLYESSIAFGIRKALKAEAGKAEMESYISKLELEKTKLDKEVSGDWATEGHYNNVSPCRLVTSRFSVKWLRRKLLREDRRKRRLMRKRLITSRRQVNSSSLNWRGSFIRNKA